MFPRLTISVCLLLLILIPCLHASAQTCLDYSEIPSVEMVLFSETYIVRDIAIVGDLLYATDDMHGLMAFDISMPDAPVHLGSLPLTEPERIACQGGLACVETGHDTLRMIDVSDPSAMVELGSLARTDATLDLFLAPSLVIQTEGDGLHVIDVSDPVNPVEVGSLAMDINRYGDLDGNLVGVSSDSPDDSLHLVDISDPTAPAVVGTFVASGYVYSLVIDGDRLHYSTSSGLATLDIGTPSSPVELGGPAYPDEGIYQMILDGDRLITREHLLDVAPDGTLSHHCSWPMNTTPHQGFDLHGDRIINFGGAYARMVDLAGAPRAGYLDRIAGNAGGLAHRDDLIFTVLDGQFTILDATDPAQLTPLGSLGPYQSHCLAVQDDVACLLTRTTSTNTASLHTLDVSDPAAPVELGQVSWTSHYPVGDIVLDGNIVYAGTVGVAVVDISDPAAPVILDSIYTEGHCTSLALDGDVLFATAKLDEVCRPSSPARTSPSARRVPQTPNGSGATPRSRSCSLSSRSDRDQEIMSCDGRAVSIRSSVCSSSAGPGKRSSRMQPASSAEPARRVSLPSRITRRPEPTALRSRKSTRRPEMSRGLSSCRPKSSARISTSYSPSVASIARAESSASLTRCLPPRKAFRSPAKSAWLSARTIVPSNASISPPG